MAYDTVHLTALLHDLGTFYRRAYPQSDVNHAKLGRTVFESTIAPRLVGLLDETALREIAAGIEAHHDNWPFVGQADQLASGAAALDPVDEQPADPANETLQCPLCRDTTPRQAGAPGRLEWTLRPRPIDSTDSLLPVQSPIIENREAEYRRLWEGFAAGAATLPNAGLGAFCESLTALLERFASAVPTSRARREPFVSLYDHSLWTAVIASCLRRLDGAAADGGEFLLCGVRLGATHGGFDRGGEAERGERTAGIRGAAIFDRALLGSLEHRLTAALDLPAACAVFRTSDETAILAPGIAAARAAFESAASALRAAAFDRWGATRSVTFAAVPVGRSHLSRFSLSVALLRRAWDVESRRPSPQVWRRPEVWRPAVPPASDHGLCARLGRALRGSPALVLRDVSVELAAAGPQPAVSGLPTPAAPVPAEGAEPTGPVEFDVFGCRWALTGANAGEPATAASPARRRISLLAPRAREIAATPPLAAGGNATAHTWELAPTVTAGAAAVPGRGRLRAVFVMALDLREPDLDAAEDAPAVFTHLARRLDLFFRRAAPARVIDRGAVVLEADRTRIAVAAVAHSALDFPARLHVDLAQYAGSHPGLTVSAALTVDRGHDSLRDQLVETRRLTALAQAAGGDRVHILGEQMSWADWFELRALADDLLAGPIRERRLNPAAPAELSAAALQLASAEFGSRRLPPTAAAALATASDEPGLPAAMHRKLGRLGDRLPLLATIAAMTLGH